MPVKIFISYAHEDEFFCKELEKHLTPLKEEGLITTWYDRNIIAGKDWEQEISKQLNKAQIILLLISPDFLASDYCNGIEMKRAMERHEKGEAYVIPIILRPVEWQRTLLGKLQVLPTDGKPIRSASWYSEDEAFVEVAKGIRSVIEEIKKQSPVFPLSSQPPEQNGKTLQHTSILESKPLSEKFLTVPEVYREPTDVISEDISQQVVSPYPKAAGDEESQRSKSIQKRRQRNLRRLLLPLAILLVLMFPLLTFLSRPLCFLTGCHSSQQPPKQLSPQNEGEVYDQNLSVQFIGTQQDTFALPGDPLRLRPNQLSKQGVPVVCIDQPKQQVPTVFRIAIRISNLRRDQYVLLIEKVQFIVEQITRIPHPLYALVQNPPALSNYNLYRGTYTYTGQDTNVPVPTTYDYPPYTYAYLNFHETDTINIQVTSLVEVLLRFRIAITYRAANENQTTTLTIPKIFQVVFSDKSNLHLYQQLRDGHFTHLDTP